MADSWNWRFFGFSTPMGNHPVQEWFDLLDPEAKDEARDRIGYLQKLPRHLWKLPEFDPLPGETVSEIRFKVGTLRYRIYGYFGPAGQRQVYTFLYAHNKKVGNDVQGKKEAAKRRRQIERKEAGEHQFVFNRKPNRTPPHG